MIKLVVLTICFSEEKTLKIPFEGSGWMLQFTVNMGLDDRYTQH